VKKHLLAGALVLGMAVAAEAQIYVDYTKKTSHGSFTLSYSSGYGYGYGYGYGGYGYSGGFGPGFVGRVGGGTLAFGVRHVLPYDFGYGGYYGPGYGEVYGYPFGYAPGTYYAGGGIYSYGTPPGLYGGYRGHPALRPPVSDHFPGPAPRATPGVSDRAHEYASAKEIEDGRRRFRMGDYRGALDEFRAAIVAHPENPLAQAYFAVALAVTGDGKHADKALRAAAEKVPFGKVELIFANDKERGRVLGLLAKTAGDGVLAAAFAASSLGEPERLKRLADKDPAAKKLLPAP
jgi:hypothetical protein